jgi:hypothetical protein
MVYNTSEDYCRFRQKEEGEEERLRKGKDGYRYGFVEVGIHPSLICGS